MEQSTAVPTMALPVSQHPNRYKSLICPARVTLVTPDLLISATTFCWYRKSASAGVITSTAPMIINVTAIAVFIVLLPYEKIRQPVERIDSSGTVIGREQLAAQVYHSRSFLKPGMGTGYLPSASDLTGGGESFVHWSMSGAYSIG